jgi:hypothetical protein
VERAPVHTGALLTPKAPSPGHNAGLGTPCWASLRQLKGRSRKKKKSDVPTYLPFLRFFEIFRSDFRKYFYGVFGLLMQRNGQKRDKKNSMGKDERKKVFFFSTFSGQKFLT